MIINKRLGKRLSVTLLFIFLVTVTILPASASANTTALYYRVEAGDSLWLIGWRFETTADEIVKLNSLKSSQIFPGQVLRIPNSTRFVREIPKTVEYTVRTGETLANLAERFGISQSSIRDANKLTGTALTVGQRLIIPLPPQQRHNVQNGDTLFILANRYKTNIDALKTVNRMNSNTLWLGQVLFVPSTAGQPPAGNEPSPPTTEKPPIVKEPVAPPAVNEPVAPPVAELPFGGQWGETPSGIILHKVQSGENLWVLARRYNTSIAAISGTNHLHSDLVMINQPLFIPQNSTKAVSIPYPFAAKKDGFGELLDWEFVSWVLDTGNTAVVQDLDTGKSFKVRRLGGSNHADVEPLTAGDTATMKSIYGGNWGWDRRAVLVQVDGKVIAGSMAGMPHDIQTIYDNNFPGHFDIHFLNSRTHNTNSIDAKHQEMVRKAAGN